MCAECRLVTLCMTMAVPGPPLLAFLYLLLPLLLSKAPAPAAAYTLTTGRQPQHKLLHLGEKTTSEGRVFEAISAPCVFPFFCYSLGFCLHCPSQTGPRTVGRPTSNRTWLRGLCLGTRRGLTPGPGRSPCRYVQRVSPTDGSQEAVADFNTSVKSNIGLEVSHF